MHRRCPPRSRPAVSHLAPPQAHETNPEKCGELYALFAEAVTALFAPPASGRAVSAPPAFHPWVLQLFRVLVQMAARDCEPHLFTSLSPTLSLIVFLHGKTLTPNLLPKTDPNYNHNLKHGHTLPPNPA